MNTNPAATGSGDKDYVDKALESAERKFGGAHGAKLAGNRSMNEKITDKARAFFEKITGKKVPSKISN
ncbi:hypothetical protein IQ07DRAFT_640332 [Pyrenochaeta sp. DS3sAY3a]|nr:hypothetical protein IQ07DRAFT_640332 [Pyrenochaeta sp. DS3sAY3a]